MFFGYIINKLIMIAKTKLSLFAQRGFLQGFRFSCKNIQIIIYNLLVVSFFVDLCFGTVSYDMNVFLHRQQPKFW